METDLPIALTCGDPAGVGPEVIENWLRTDVSKGFKVVPIGPQRWLERLPVEGVAVGCSDFIGVPGKPSEAGAQIALEALDLSAQGCLNGEFAGVVTGPVSKQQMRTVGFAYPGQTEFFADRWNGDATMGFAGEKLRVVLATWHIPFKEVAKVIHSTDALKISVERAALLGKLEGFTHPRIAVCGLNPHAGEGGELGSEEIDCLNPVLDKLRNRFPLLSPCLPPDTVFHRLLEGEFDVAVALYHDQGLIPFKTLEFHTGVNVSLGLPYVRTSPDHGTAFTIAGKHQADFRSFGRAVEVAAKHISAS